MEQCRTDIGLIPSMSMFPGVQAECSSLRQSGSRVLQRVSVAYPLLSMTVLFSKTTSSEEHYVKLILRCLETWKFERLSRESNRLSICCDVKRRDHVISCSHPVDSAYIGASAYTRVPANLRCYQARNQQHASLTLSCGCANTLYTACCLQTICTPLCSWIYPTSQ
jgi:hypothetical protein